MNRVRFESRAWHGGATTAAVLGVYFLSSGLPLWARGLVSVLVGILFITLLAIRMAPRDS